MLFRKLFSCIALVNDRVNRLLICVALLSIHSWPATANHLTPAGDCKVLEQWVLGGPPKDTCVCMFGSCSPENRAMKFGSHKMMFYDWVLFKGNVTEIHFAPDWVF